HNYTYEIYLYDKDRFMPIKGEHGTLKANKQQLIFSYDNSTEVIHIDLKDIVEADFKNIIAKTQFIISQNDGKTYVFGFAPPTPLHKAFLIGAFRPLNGTFGFLEASNNAMKARKCKEELLTLLPSTIVKTQKEIQ